MYAFFLVLPLMMLIALGNLLKVRGFYSKEDISALTKTLYWVILPALLFSTAYGSGKELLAQPNLFIAANVCFVATIAIAWTTSRFCVHKGKARRIAVSVTSAIRANNIYLGFPVILLALGETGLHQASVYIAVTTVSFQLISMTASELAMSGTIGLRGLYSIFVNILKNPMVSSCIAGVTLAIAGVPIPMVAMEAMKLLSAAATAVALLSLGGSLDFSSVRRVVMMIRVTLFDCVVRLFISPLLMWLCLLIWPVEQQLAQVSVMLASMPAAVNVFILSKEMHMDEEYGAELVAATTVLGTATIPAWAAILGIV